MQTALIIIHVVIAVILTAIVLMQHGKQQGLSGAIAGGAETFFGKNKGRTVDAMLKKFTAVVAILFIISSIVLTTVSINKYNSENAVTDENAESGEETQSLNTDENGNLLNADGSLMTDGEGNPININQLQTVDGQTEGGEVPADDQTIEGDAPAAEGEAPAADGEVPAAE